MGSVRERLFSTVTTLLKPCTMGMDFAAFLGTMDFARGSPYGTIYKTLSL